MVRTSQKDSVSPSFQKGHGNLLWTRAHEARESQLLGHIKCTNVFCKDTYKYMLYIKIYYIFSLKLYNKIHSRQYTIWITEQPR